MIEIDDIEKTIFDTVSQVATVKKIDVYDTEKLVFDVAEFLIEHVTKNEHHWPVQRFAMQYAVNRLLQKSGHDNQCSRDDLFDHFKKCYDRGLTMGEQWRQELYQGLSHKSSPIATAGTSFLTASTPKR